MLQKCRSAKAVKINDDDLRRFQTLALEHCMFQHKTIDFLNNFCTFKRG